MDVRRRLALGITVAVSLAAVAIVLLVSRGGAGGGPGGGAPPVSVGPGSVREGQAPPDFEGTAVDGSALSLRALHGKVVLVNFFATWCTNCRAELPYLEQTYRQQRPRGLAIVTVDFKDGGDARAMLSSAGVTFPALLDPDSSVGRAYGVEDLPETVALGRDGRVAAVFHGQLSAATLPAIIDPLLAAPG